jgi:hypothetical protein
MTVFRRWVLFVSLLQAVAESRLESTCKMPPSKSGRRLAEVLSLTPLDDGNPAAPPRAALGSLALLLDRFRAA